MEKFIPKHIHLLLQGELLKSMTEAECKEWLKNLVELVRMKVVAGPLAYYVSEPGNEGVTGIVSLATSHAAIHIWDAENPIFFQFDIYSCTDFSKDEVLNYFRETLGLENEKYLFLNRDDGFEKI